MTTDDQQLTLEFSEPPFEEQLLKCGHTMFDSPDFWVGTVKLDLALLRRLKRYEARPGVVGMDFVNMIAQYKRQYPALKTLDYCLVTPHGYVLKIASEENLIRDRVVIFCITRDWMDYAVTTVPHVFQAVAKWVNNVDIEDVLFGRLVCAKAKVCTSEPVTEPEASRDPALQVYQPAAQVTDGATDDDEEVEEESSQEERVARAQRRREATLCTNVSRAFRPVVAPLPTGRNIYLQIPDDCDVNGLIRILGAVGWSSAAIMVAMARRISSFWVTANNGQLWVPAKENAFDLVRDFQSRFPRFGAYAEMASPHPRLTEFAGSDVVSVAFLGANGRVTENMTEYNGRDLSIFEPEPRGYELLPAAAAIYDVDYYVALRKWLLSVMTSEGMLRSRTCRLVSVTDRTLIMFVSGLLTGKITNAAGTRVTLSDGSVLREARDLMHQYRATRGLAAKQRGSAKDQVYQRGLLVATFNAFMHGGGLDMTWCNSFAENSGTSVPFPILRRLDAEVAVA